MATSIDLINEIISRPNPNPYNNYNTSFNSNALRTSWDTAQGNRNYRGDDFNSPFFKLFWRTIKHLTGRNEDFKLFIETFLSYCGDHSSTLPPIAEQDRLLCNIRNRNRYTTRDEIDPEEARQPLKGCSRLYYIASGINNIPNHPSDQEETDTGFPAIFKAAESHSLQKALIKLREGDSITTKIYKNKLTEARIIYFNKYDVKAVAYLQVYAITRSWPNYVLGRIDHPNPEIATILNMFYDRLIHLTPETILAALPENEAYSTIAAALKKIDDNLTKIEQSDSTLDAFAQHWQKRLFNSEKGNAENEIQRQQQSAKQHMEAYYQCMEQIRQKEKLLRGLLMNEEDAAFLKNYFLKFKTIPGAIFHRAGNNKLYCLFEVPFAHADYKALEKHIKDINETMNPRNETHHNGSYFASALWWALNRDANSYWQNPIIKGYKPELYWPAFIKAFKRLCLEIFVSRKTMLFITTCIVWNNESNAYQPQGVRINDLPPAFQPFITERLWHPHIVHYNCWSAAQSEITKSLSNRNFEDAFLYTISAAQQISYMDAAGGKIARYLVGDNCGYYNNSTKDAAENHYIFQREGQEKRENLREILEIYVAEALKGVAPVETVETKPAPTKSIKTIEERNIWLEQHHYVPHAGLTPEQIPSTTDTRFRINGQEYIWIPTGDLLSLPEYERYVQLFPGHPISPNPVLTAEVPPTPPVTIQPADIADHLTPEALIQNPNPQTINGIPTARVIEQAIAEAIQNGTEANTAITDILETVLRAPVDTVPPTPIPATPNEPQPEVTEIVPEPTPTPEPEPDLRFISLIYQTDGNWSFPRAGDMPAEFADFNCFVPEWNGITDDFMPDTPSELKYDTLEDIIFCVEDGERHLLATGVVEQLRRVLP